MRYRSTVRRLRRFPPLHVVSFLLGLLLGWAPTAVEAAGADSLSYRWGVGWDQGLGVRYLLSPAWGLGLRVNPWINTHDIAATYSQQSMDDKTVSLGVLAFQQTRIGRWVLLGPYAGVSYSHSKYESNSEYATPSPLSSIRRVTTDDTWAVEIGFRPAFAIEDRFVLESRFGFGYRRSSTEESSEEVQSGSPPESESRTLDRWEFYTTGHNLGFGSTLQFMIYF